MPIKVVITRSVPAELGEVVKPMLIELRTRAMEQPGYISGESLVSVDKPEEHVVISTWKSMRAWKDWLKDPVRIDVQSKIDECLGGKTRYRVYQNR